MKNVVQSLSVIALLSMSGLAVAGDYYHSQHRHGGHVHQQHVYVSPPPQVVYVNPRVIQTPPTVYYSNSYSGPQRNHGYYGSTYPHHNSRSPDYYSNNHYNRWPQPQVQHQPHSWQYSNHGYNRHGYDTGGAVIGSLLGAAIGSQIGSGSGNTAAIIIGTTIGAAIGGNR